MRKEQIIKEMLTMDEELKVLAMNVKKLQAIRRLIESIGIEEIEAIVKKEEQHASSSKKEFYNNLIEELDYIKHFKELRQIKYDIIKGKRGNENER